MATTYKPHHYGPHLHLTPCTYYHHHRPTWSETQATLLLSLRDVSNRPTKNPDPDVRDFDAHRQIHARWTDPGIVDALSQLQNSLPPKAKLSFKYGGRDVTESTWILVYLTLPSTSPELKYVLWFHEYDDLDVEVGELSGVNWGVDVKKEEVNVKEEEAGVGMGVGIGIGVKREVKVDVNVNVKMENVKMENVEMDW